MGAKGFAPFLIIAGRGGLLKAVAPLADERRLENRRYPKRKGGGITATVLRYFG